MIIRIVVPNIAKDPRRDFLSRQGIKVVRPFFPINAAIGSAIAKTNMAKIKENGVLIPNLME